MNQLHCTVDQNEAFRSENPNRQIDLCTMSNLVHKNSMELKQVSGNDTHSEQPNSSGSEKEQIDLPEFSSDIRQNVISSLSLISDMTGPFFNLNSSQDATSISYDNECLEGVLRNSLPLFGLVETDEFSKQCISKEADYSTYHSFNSTPDSTTFVNSPALMPVVSCGRSIDTNRCARSNDSGNSKLEITFLNSSEDGGKYGRHHEVIYSESGDLTLFVERGCVLDTRIIFYPDESHSQLQLESVGLKLRFTPYTVYGGIVKPAIGYHDHLQNCHVAPTDCLCFIQTNGDSEVCVTYKKLSSGLLVMETPILDYRGIYRLFFPFLNSKCPSTCRKDVFIQASVLYANDIELIQTRFQVVCCATPTRDAKRFRNRQSNCSTVNKSELDFSSSKPAISSPVNECTSTPQSNIDPGHQSTLLHYSNTCAPSDLSVPSNNSEGSLTSSSDYFSGSTNGSYRESDYGSPVNCLLSQPNVKRKHPEELETDKISNDDTVYTIQTKSRRIYCILNYLNEELSKLTKL